MTEKENKVFAKKLYTGEIVLDFFGGFDEGEKKECQNQDGNDKVDEISLECTDVKVKASIDDFKQKIQNKCKQNIDVYFFKHVNSFDIYLEDVLVIENAHKLEEDEEKKILDFIQYEQMLENIYSIHILEAGRISDVFCRIIFERNGFKKVKYVGMGKNPDKMYVLEELIKPQIDLDKLTNELMTLETRWNTLSNTLKEINLTSDVSEDEKEKRETFLLDKMDKVMTEGRSIQMNVIDNAHVLFWCRNCDKEGYICQLAIDSAFNVYKFYYEKEKYFYTDEDGYEWGIEDFYDNLYRPEPDLIRKADENQKKEWLTDFFDNIILSKEE